MNDKIKFALIGCGAISRKHIEALDRIEDAEVAAVVDKNLEAAKAVGEKYGIPYYDDRKIMAEEHEIDVLNILTPSGDHARCHVHCPSAPPPTTSLDPRRRSQPGTGCFPFF